MNRLKMEQSRTSMTLRTSVYPGQVQRYFEQGVAIMHIHSAATPFLNFVIASV